MTSTPILKLRRSGAAHLRPDPSEITEGEVALNYNSSSSGLFFLSHLGDLVKLGPVEVSAVALNSDPAGSEGNSVGELWYDETNEELKIWHDGSWKKVIPDPVGYTGSFLADTQTVTVVNGIITGVS